MLRGPILAWSNRSRTAASSASGVGALLPFAGPCADSAGVEPPLEPITPPSISPSQPRRSRNTVLDSAPSWRTRMINQPFRARPGPSSFPQFQHISRSRHRKQVRLRLAWLAGSDLPRSRENWRQGPLHDFHARIGTRDATRSPKPGAEIATQHEHAVGGYGLDCTSWTSLVVSGNTCVAVGTFQLSGCSATLPVGMMPSPRIPVLFRPHE